MARKLAGDAQELTEHFAACTLSHKFRDARVVENVVEVEVDGVRTIQVVYFQAEAYPASPAMLMCNDDEQLNGELQALNDQFEEYAVFFDVFRALCGVLKLESDVQILDEMDASMAEIAADEENDGASDGSGSEAGFFDMGDDKDDVQLMREVLQKVSRWTKLEDKREHLENEHKAQAELDAGRGAYLPEVQTHLEEVASRNQIFNVREAFAMLSRELSDMMRDKSMPCTIDAVEDDAYHWEIAFKGFDPSSLLAQDLEELEQRHGQSAVVLRMEFKRGLHPFYPPAIRLLRPRCAAPLLGALSSHPMLRLRNWDPWRPQRDLIQQLRLFLQSHARICIESALNAPGVENAYLDIEKLLAKLEALTGVLPAGHQQFEAIYSGRLTGVDEQHLLALAPSNKRPKTADAHRRAWAAGTGYSSGHHSAGPVWDVQKARLAQSAQDAELKRVFSLLASAMAPRQSARSSARASAKPRSSERADMSSDEAAQAIRESCLVPFLEAELSQASFTDMGNRSMYYVDLLRVVSCLAVPKHASLLFTSQTPAAATEKGKTVFGNLCTLQRQASHFLSVLQASRHPTTPPVASAAAPQDEHAAAVEENTVKQMAERIIQTHKQAQSLEAGQRHGSATSDSQGPVAGSDEAYVAAMRPLQLGFLEGIASNHKYREKPRAEGAQPRPRTVRLGKEIASLSADLPLSPTSSVFVRVDEQNATLWRALITGPAGTPYSGGCFMFDIYFQPEYPSVPPLVLITTTGGGSVRFGPNLYNCGKVCLSLLGTWSGGRGEGWDLSVSTTLQVLVSIQSLIFVDEPYYCEPGFEAQMHTATGNKASKAYTLDIREQTMHWAIWQQMKSPPKGFEDVVRTHFKQRQKHVRETCQQWVDEATADNAACAPRMAKFLRDIKQELAKR